MRDIKYLVVHCTATAQSAKVESIKRYWKDVLKWKQVGYHFIVEASGKIHQLADIKEVTNGVKGFNSNSIHFCYIGGLKSDDRTQAQKDALEWLLKEHKEMFPNAIIQGHRDFPGVKKDCPRFNAKVVYQHI